VVDGVLALRGFGTTDVAGALLAAAEQLARSRAARRITVLLSDCRATEPGDVTAAAAALDELVIIAPAGDSEDAETLAASVGALLATVSGPSEIPEALARVLEQ
jgi:Mg-chelatase subunit ChlD